MEHLVKRTAFLKRTALSEERVRTILGLPDDGWNDLQVEFGHDGIATARVSLLLSKDQLLALADVLTDSGEGT